MKTQRKGGNSRFAGLELRKLIGRLLFINEKHGCGCSDLEARMNGNGCDWCESEEGMEAIVKGLRANAAKLGIPFFEPAARMLVKRAIKNAKKATLE